MLPLILGVYPVCIFSSHPQYYYHEMIKISDFSLIYFVEMQRKMSYQMHHYVTTQILMTALFPHFVTQRKVCYLNLLLLVHYIMHYQLHCIPHNLLHHILYYHLTTQSWPLLHFHMILSQHLNQVWLKTIKQVGKGLQNQVVHFYIDACENAIKTPFLNITIIH